MVDYRAGDLERRYPKLGLEEDFFVNYGFLQRHHQQLMHPRTARALWTPARWKQAQAVRDFVAERGIVHPREVDARFAHGKAINWFGGSSNASTQLLDGMHYRGLLRVARRAGGTRLYAVREPACAPEDGAAVAARMDALLDIAVNTYAPLPAASLGQLLSLLCLGVPQWRNARAATLARAKRRLGHARVGGVEWYWPSDENPVSARRKSGGVVRLLTPFDPVVWDRRRFEIFWNWRYRFEAYTPAPKRKLGYYALPLLRDENVIGWANAAVRDGALQCSFGYVAGDAPRNTGFADALEAELARIRMFLGLED